MDSSVSTKSKSKASSSTSTSSTNSAGTGNKPIKSKMDSRASGKNHSSIANVQIANTDEGDESNCKRLWIGNLDAKLTDIPITKCLTLVFLNVTYYGFHLLKLVQQYGSIDHFDFLFHRTPGPNFGLPRGYVFVTYKETEDAEKCLQRLNGKRVLNKHVVVRWAQQTTFTYPDEEEKLRMKLPVLGNIPGKTIAGPGLEKQASASTNSQSKERTISDIEAKLKSMERDALSFNLIGIGPAGSSTSTSNVNPTHRYLTNPASSSTSNARYYHQRPPHRDHHHHNYKNSRPYARRRN